MSGQTVTRDGKAIVYTGYQWRGRSQEGASDKDPFREVLMVERDLRQMSGRWFNGAYNENGIDVKLLRLGNDPVVLGLATRSVKTGAKCTATIHGANLPATLAPTAIDFGQGVRVVRVGDIKPDSVTVDLETAADAPAGVRDVYVAGAVAPAAAVVYDKVDFLKVRPQAGMARNGGIRFPKQYQQFEAIAYNNGPDGKPNTKDDIEIGPAHVTWKLEEFAATLGDDDIQYVGTLDDNGLFTPNVDGPNPARRHGTNNYGDVWVVATYTPPSEAKDPRPLRARAHLLVTVPLYIKFDQPEVAP
jgi:quinohemoprotein amine dehydrogenase